MKELLESLLYPQNIFLWLLLAACIAYRKKGLWLLFLFYYLIGNTFIANQVRQLYQSQFTSAGTKQMASVVATSEAHYVLLGCGGSARRLPACAQARLRQLAAVLPKHQPAAVTITTRYCQPYIDYLLDLHKNIAVNCFDGGENTYQEFYRLRQYLDAQQPVWFITSDYHGWRVNQLINYHQLNGAVKPVSSQTFRPLNCSLSCMVTVNLSNFDLYSKLMAEFSSYAVYALSRHFITWQPVPLQE